VQQSEAAMIQRDPPPEGAQAATPGPPPGIDVWTGQVIVGVTRAHTIMQMSGMTLKNRAAQAVAPLDGACSAIGGTIIPMYQNRGGDAISRLVAYQGILQGASAALAAISGHPHSEEELNGWLDPNSASATGALSAMMASQEQAAPTSAESPGGRPARHRTGPAAKGVISGPEI
jgi:hypothetical protein